MATFLRLKRIYVERGQLQIPETEWNSDKQYQQLTKNKKSASVCVCVCIKHATTVHQTEANTLAAEKQLIEQKLNHTWTMYLLNLESVQQEILRMRGNLSSNKGIRNSTICIYIKNFKLYVI